MSHEASYPPSKSIDDYNQPERDEKNLSMDNPYNSGLSTPAPQEADSAPHYDPPPPPPYTLSAADPFHPAADRPSPLPSIHRAPTPDPQLFHISKPIAIPATNAKVGSPFLRAYAPILASHSIPPSIFLAFMDDLNRVAVANPPLQILGLAGNIVSFVPVPSAQIVGQAVGLASTIGTRVISKGRTELFLRKANTELFGPRGLQVEIGKLDALAKLAHMPILNVEGKIDEHAAILQPLPGGEDIYTLSGQQRRLDTLQPWIEHLDITPLPPLHVPDNSLSKLSAGASEQMRKRGEKKLLRGREKAHEEYHKEAAKAEKDFRKEMQKLDEEEAKVRRKGGSEKLDKIARERAKVEREYDKEMGKVEEDKVKDDKEEELMRKIMWLIIRRAEHASPAGEENPYIEEHV